MDKECLTVEVVYGLAERQELRRLDVAIGTTAREAVALSGMHEVFPNIDIASAPLGIFGKAVADHTVLRENDRVEIYRPLLIDPKEARRRRVAEKKYKSNAKP